MMNYPFNTHTDTESTVVHIAVHIWIIFFLVNVTKPDTDHIPNMVWPILPEMETECFHRQTPMM